LTRLNKRVNQIKSELDEGKETFVDILELEQINDQMQLV
jgi:hypothetical protein